jgi:cyclase
LKIPLTVLGGAGSLSDFQSLIARYGLIGAAAGSYFVFKGKYRAVLIQYVSEIDKAQINSALEK